jgi:glycosyltransferase involved in cell wall biosynthesis
MKLLSVCIPTYEMHGKGVEFLEFNFKILEIQTFKDFDVIISDHSLTDDIQQLCEKYKSTLDIKYFRNTEKRGSQSPNINNAIRHSDSKLIKVLFQDDFLFSENSLEITVNHFNLEKDKWLVSRCQHSMDGTNFIRDFIPRYNHNIHLGINTISSPSVLTILNETPLLFDENLINLMDCDYYKRCYIKFGEPKILKVITVVNRMGDHQATHTIVNEELNNKEVIYVKEKFKDEAN